MYPSISSTDAMGEVIITPEHVAAFRASAPGSLLMWRETDGQVLITDLEGPLDPAMKVILASLDGLIEGLEDTDRAVNDHSLAEQATEMFNDIIGDDWPRERALVHSILPIRRRLATAGVITTGTIISAGDPRLMDFYNRHGSEWYADLSVGFGFQAPVTVRVSAPHGQSALSSTATLDVSPYLPHDELCARIADHILRALPTED